MTKEDLKKIRQWADDKIATGEEPPWAWFQYMKLRETLDAILGGRILVVHRHCPGRFTISGRTSG